MERYAHRLSKVLLAVSVSLSATGCSVFSSDDSDLKMAPLPDFESEIKIRKAWSRSVGEGSGERFVKLSPAFDGEAVYVADIEGQVRSFNAKSGRKLWRQRLKTPLSGGVGAGHGLVLLGSQGEVIALNKIDGSLVWRSKVSSEILSVPKTNGQVVVVQTSDEKIYGFDHATGEQRWLHESLLPALTQRGTASPQINADVVVTGLANGRLVVLAVDSGRMLWERRVSVPQGKSELERMTDVDASPLLHSSGVIYAVGLHGKVMAIEARTARILWQKEMSGFQQPAEGFSQLYLVDDQDSIQALDSNSANTKVEITQFFRFLTQLQRHQCSIIAINIEQITLHRRCDANTITVYLFTPDKTAINLG